MIDLHTHSTASDGTLTPAALVDLAAEKKLTAIALTDHDTVAGVPEAVAHGAGKGIEIIPGVEIGVRWDRGGAMHLLGYYIRSDEAQLRERLGGLRLQRRQRAQRMVALLNELGVEMSFSRVEQMAMGESIGRPHVARALLQAGAVRNPEEAFRRYLSSGRPAYVQRELPSPQEGIAWLKAAGGVAVLAHPSTLRLGRKELGRCVEELKGHGLEGIEVFWSGHNRAQQESYRALAQRLGLLVTGGSDFHGATKSDIELGTGLKGNVRVPESYLTALRAYAHARGSA
jgi:predicted metal-dependent phosphoesterase TrpH